VNVKSSVLQYGTGVIAEGEQYVVVEFFEPSGTICADDGALEVIVDVDRHGDQALDLPVGQRVTCSGLILTHDLVPLEHALREALRHVTVRGIVLEAPMRDQVQPAVVISILPAEQQPFLGSNELDCDS
jgi:hypothetical protein